MKAWVTVKDGIVQAALLPTILREDLAWQLGEWLLDGETPILHDFEDEPITVGKPLLGTPSVGAAMLTTAQLHEWRALAAGPANASPDTPILAERRTLLAVLDECIAGREAGWRPVADAPSWSQGAQAGRDTAAKHLLALTAVMQPTPLPMVQEASRAEYTRGIADAGRWMEQARPATLAAEREAGRREAMEEAATICDEAARQDAACGDDDGATTAMQCAASIRVLSPAPGAGS